MLCYLDYHFPCIVVIEYYAKYVNNERYMTRNRVFFLKMALTALKKELTENTQAAHTQELVQKWRAAYSIKLAYQENFRNCDNRGRNRIWDGRTRGS